MTPSDKHNDLAREFVMKVAGETRTHSEMMVVVESVILATMLVTTRRDGFAPKQAAEFVESAVQAATERFVEASR